MRARVRRLEPGQHAQQRGLAAAGRAEQREEFAGRDVERQAVDRGEAAERLDHRLDAQQAGAAIGLACGSVVVVSSAMIPASACRRTLKHDPERAGNRDRLQPQHSRLPADHARGAYSPVYADVP